MKRLLADAEKSMLIIIILYSLCGQIQHSKQLTTYLFKNILLLLQEVQICKAYRRDWWLKKKHVSGCFAPAKVKKKTFFFVVLSRKSYACPNTMQIQLCLPQMYFLFIVNISAVKVINSLYSQQLHWQQQRMFKQIFFLLLMIFFSHFPFQKGCWKSLLLYVKGKSFRTWWSIYNQFI